jgi:signal transduction histidine kinase
LRGAGDELDRLSAVLNQMLGRLESAFQLVTQFTADASHELRTPVGIIRTTAEVIRLRRRTPEEHEAAWDQVILQSERMSGLIGDLLALARADAGRGDMASDMAMQPMDLAATLASIVEEIRILAESSGLRLRTFLDAECPMTGDPDAIRRLFLVLLDNAIKYTPSGGEVEIRLRTVDSLGAPAAVVEVRDTGPGIDAQHLRRIFDRFYRVSADRSRNTGGAGLGLSIAQWLASLHGGEITVESAPGAGSTFRVILPLGKMTHPNSAFLQNQPA